MEVAFNVSYLIVNFVIKKIHAQLVSLVILYLMFNSASYAWRIANLVQVNISAKVVNLDTL